MSLNSGFPSTTELTLSMWFQVPTGLNATDNLLPLWEMGGIPPAFLNGTPTFSWLILPPIDPPDPDWTGPLPETPLLLPFWGSPTNHYIGIDYPAPRWDPNDPANSHLNGTFALAWIHFYSNNNSFDSDPFPYNSGGYVLNATAGSPELTAFYKYSYVILRGAANNLKIDCVLRSPLEPFVYSTDGSDNVNRTQLSHIQNFSNPFSSTPITAGSWHHLMIAAQLNGTTILDQPETAPIKLHKLVIMVDGVVHTSNTYNPDSVPGRFTSFETLLDDSVHPYRYLDPGPGSPGLMVGNVHLPRNPEANSGYITNVVSDNYDRAGLGSSVFGGSQSDKLRRFAHVQFWVDQFIDPRIAGNFEKFVTINGAVGTPAPATAAAAAFGQQAIYLHGKSSDAAFFDNRGNGGGMSRVGTFSDFTPSPSY